MAVKKDLCWPKSSTGSEKLEEEAKAVFKQDMGVLHWALLAGQQKTTSLVHSNVNMQPSYHFLISMISKIFQQHIPDSTTKGSSCYFGKGFYYIIYLER